MKKKSNKPTMGRPKKQPSHLEKFTPVLVLYDDVKKILIKYNVPRAGWTYMDVMVLIEWILTPAAFSALKTEVPKPFEIKYVFPPISFAVGTEWTLEHIRIVKALHLAKLFAESPEGLVEALPKIYKKIALYFTNPMKAAVMNEAIRSGWLNSSPDFWTKPAKELASKNTTARTIENAREKIRKILK